MARSRALRTLPVVQLALLLAGCCALVALVAGQAKKISERKISDQDLDRVLNNNALTNFYVQCLLDKGACDRDGRELKSTVPRALATGCEGCSDNQRRATDRVIRHLRAKRPRDWVALTAKYDPKGEYERRFASVTVSPPTSGRRAGKSTGPKPTAPTTPKH